MVIRMEEKNTLLIIGVVLSILLPPVGIIICLICLNDINKNNKTGKNLAINGIMVGILMVVVLIVGTIGITVYHNKREEKQEQREKYKRELKKVCDNLDRNGNYDSYDKEHPKKKFIQCHSGECFMYKDGETLETYDCDLGW